MYDYILILKYTSFFVANKLTFRTYPIYGVIQNGGVTFSRITARPTASATLAERSGMSVLCNLFVFFIICLFLQCVYSAFDILRVAAAWWSAKRQASSPASSRVVPRFTRRRATCVSCTTRSTWCAFWRSTKSTPCRCSKLRPFAGWTSRTPTSARPKRKSKFCRMSSSSLSSNKYNSKFHASCESLCLCGVKCCFHGCHFTCDLQISDTFSLYCFLYSY